ncbi:MAG: fibronectin type III domain-containing protein [Ruminococcus sp.]|nr:fibronectin type III domain-containing protein [Ruminococcus sp.]
MRKQIISGLLAACMAVSCLAVPASKLSDKLITSDVVASAATEYTSGDYTYTVSNGKATIVRYNGSATNLTIPSKLGGYKVTKIGDCAFENNMTLKKVTIPNTVTSIGSGAFLGCYSLKQINIPKSVKSIGKYAMGGDDNTFRISGVRIRCYKGSKAEAYAKKYAIAYTLIDGETSDVEVPAIKDGFTASSTAIRIKWTKVEDASGYRIYQYNSTTKTWEKVGVVRNGSTTNYKITGLSAAKKYKFKVQAYVKNGGKIYSSTKSKTYVAATTPEKVTNVTATKTKTTVDLKWNKVKCAGYCIQQYDSSSKTWETIDYADPSDTSYTVTGLKKGTVYKFRIAARKTVPMRVISRLSNEGVSTDTIHYRAVSVYSYSATKKVTTKS